MVTTLQQERYVYLGISSLLYSLDPDPASRPCGHIMPVLTGDHTSEAIGTSGLIKVESVTGHVYTFSTWTNEVLVTRAPQGEDLSVVNTFAHPPRSTPFSSGEYQAP